MVKEKFDLSGRRGIVTGASRGLGAGMAAGLAEMGADLVIAARSKEDLEHTAERLRGFGGTVIPCIADMADDAQIERLVDCAVRELGGIDFVFANAGIIRRTPAHEHSLEDFDAVMQVNVHAVFHLAAAAARVMIAAGTKGSIVLTDSVVSRYGSRNVSAYAASKGAVNALTRALANDWGRYGIRVNGIAPGFSETDMTAEVREDSGRRKALDDRMALGRWGRPEDFAGIAVFLAGDASAYVTGATFVVDGGFLGM